MYGHILPRRTFAASCRELLANENGQPARVIVWRCPSSPSKSNAAYSACRLELQCPRIPQRSCPFWLSAPRIRVFGTFLAKWRGTPRFPIWTSSLLGAFPGSINFLNPGDGCATGTGSAHAKLLVPRRWNHVSASLSNWFCRKRFSQTGTPDVVVFTWPQLAYLAEKLCDVTRVYYCKDPFEHWTWGANYIRPFETRLLENVDAVFAVSRLMISDLGSRTRAKVFYLPNGFCDWFLDDASAPPLTCLLINRSSAASASSTGITIGNIFRRLPGLCPRCDSVFWAAWEIRHPRRGGKSQTYFAATPTCYGSAGAITGLCPLTCAASTS